MASNEECFRKCDLIDKYLLDKLRTESTEFYGCSPNKIRFTTKTVYQSVMRPSLQSKKRTHQKTQPAKPLNVYNYSETFFTLQVPKLGKTEKMSQILTISPNKILPTSSSKWIDNSKKIQQRQASSNRGGSLESKVVSPDQSERKRKTITREDIIHDMKDYMQSMKQYLKNQKSRLQYHKKLKNQKPGTQRYDEEDEKEDLNIIPLKPNIEYKVKKKMKLTKAIVKQCQKDLKNQFLEIQNSSAPYFTQQRKLSKPSPYTSRKNSLINNEVPQLLKRKQQKCEDVHNIFGKSKQNDTEEAISKLRHLYYRDFIWKIHFNQGFMYECSGQPWRFYIGKGNNSRLIRKIMKKKNWWIEETRQDQAHFVWTQLKIYDIYKSQKSYKSPAYEENLNRISHAETQTSSINRSQEITDAAITNTQKITNLLNMKTVDKNKYIMKQEKYQAWRNYIKVKAGRQRKAEQDMQHRKILCHLQTRRQLHKMTNHLQFSRVIGNKKALYKTMQIYFDLYETQSYLPRTFHITGGLEDEEYLRFLREYYQLNKQGNNCWIVKPGELSNRGRDIKYCTSLTDIKDQVKKKIVHATGCPKTHIVQMYIDKPLLYNGRKFDLRHYLMVTSTEGKLRGYFYELGYVRTTSYLFSLVKSQPQIHLTNDAIQKQYSKYGKYQKANKLSYAQLDEYMRRLNPKRGFYDVVFPQIKKIGKQIVHAAFPYIDPERRANNFEIFGIDIMIDADYKCWLIEVNTNPCLQVNCPVLSAIIPDMLQNAFNITIDSQFVCPIRKMKLSQTNTLESNKFQLVFDEEAHGQPLLRKYGKENIDIGMYGDDEDNYESCDEEDYDQ